MCRGSPWRRSSNGDWPAGPYTSWPLIYDPWTFSASESDKSEPPALKAVLPPPARAKPLTLGAVAAEAKARGGRAVTGGAAAATQASAAAAGSTAGDSMAALAKVRAGKKASSPAALSAPLPFKSSRHRRRQVCSSSPTPDAQQRTYWWNTVNDTSTYEFPTARADLDPSIRIE